MIIEILTIFFLTVVILGCGEKKRNSSQRGVENQISQEEVKKDSISFKKEISPIETKAESTTNENVVRITFKEFIIEIDGIEVWDEVGNLRKVQNDTVTVYLELGETIEGQSIKIVQQNEGEIKIFQHFENSVTVMNEGAHCDLTEWKHFNSDWKELKIRNGKFLTDSYSEKDRERFIDVDMNELQEAVRNMCGEGWTELIKDVKSPTEYPCGVSMSRIFLKIEFDNQNDGTLKEKIISFEIPMGC